MYLLCRHYYIEGYYRCEAPVALFDTEEDATAFGEKHYADNGDVSEGEKGYEVVEMPTNPHLKSEDIVRLQVLWKGQTPGSYTVPTDMETMLDHQGTEYEVIEHEVTLYEDLEPRHTDAHKFEDTYSPCSASIAYNGIHLHGPVLQGSREFVNTHMEEAIASVAAAMETDEVKHFQLLEANGGYNNYISPTRDAATGEVFVKHGSGPDKKHIRLGSGDVFRVYHDTLGLTTMKVVSCEAGSRVSRQGNPLPDYKYLFRIGEGEDAEEMTVFPSHTLILVE